MGIKRKTTEEFKNEVFEKYGNDYIVLGDYINNKFPIKMKHACGKIFEVKPNWFFSYKEPCPICNNSKKLKTHDTFVKEVTDLYGDEYTVLGTYINADTKIEILHNVCNKSRYALPFRILKGDRCCFCYGDPKKTINEFKKEVFEKDNGKIIVLSDVYVNNKTKMKFKCGICNKEFYSTANNILSGGGCPHCNRSKAETIITNILERNNVSFTVQKNFKDLYYKNKRNKLKFDFEIFFDSKIILLEFDGEQHFHATNRFTKEEVAEIHTRDILKNEYCLQHNIELMRIPYTHFKQLYAIIKNLISSTTIPDEFRVVDSSGSKYSALLYNNNDDIV